MTTPLAPEEVAEFLLAKDWADEGWKRGVSRCEWEKVAGVERCFKCERLARFCMCGIDREDVP